MSRRFLIKFSYLPIRRLKELNKSLERRAEELGKKTIHAYLLDSPTSKSYHTIRWFDPNEKGYFQKLKKKILNTQSIADSKTIILEPHPKDPKIPLLLRNSLNYDGSIYLLNSLGDDTWTFKNEINGYFFDISELIENIYEKMK